MHAASPKQHFDRPTLKDYLAGRLDDDISERIESHLNGCQLCCQTIHEFEMQSSRDSLVGRLRLAHSNIGKSDQTKDVTNREIPGYKVQEELGRGGMGVVYRAVDLRLKRQVALKVILTAEHASTSDLERFKSEAETIASLKHSGIVDIYDIGEHNGRPYLALELVEGTDLHQYTDRKPQPANWSAKLIEHLARAVHSAHRQSIVHRDLKPANILIEHAQVKPNDITTVSKAANDTQSEDQCNQTIPVAKITDFGVAKHMDIPGGHTRMGMVVGTPGYMAPEQTTGQGELVGPSADIFALGAILYELLTGRPPFQSDDLWETMRLTRDNDPVPPSELRPGLTRDLETICSKCLSKEPSWRYDSAEALADDLNRFLGHEPIVARPAGAIKRAAMWTRRRPAIALLFVSIILGTFATTWQWRVAVAAQRKESEIRRVTQEQVAETTLEQWAEVSKQSGFEALPFLLKSIAARRGALDDQPERLIREEAVFRLRALNSLRSLPKLVQVWSPTGVVLHAEYQKNGSRVLVLDAEVAPVLYDTYSGESVFTAICDADIKFTTGALSPDGLTVAAADDAGTVYIWKLKTGANVDHLLEHGQPVDRLHFSYDGKFLAVESCRKALEGEVPPCSVWNTSDGSLIARPDTRGRLHRTHFSSDNSQLAYDCGRQFGAWDLQMDQAVDAFRRRITRWVNDDGSQQLVFDRRLIATDEHLPDQSSTLFMSDIRDSIFASSSEWHSRFTDGAPVAVSFSADRSSIALGFPSDGVIIWNLSTNDLIRCATPASVLKISFSPCSRYLAVATEDQRLRVYDAETGQLAGPKLPHGDVAFDVQFHPTGQLLLSTSRDGSVRQWDLHPPEPITIVPHSSATWAQFTADGKSLVTAGRDGMIRFWVPDGATELANPLTVNGPIDSLSMATDGQSLVATCQAEFGSTDQGQSFGGRGLSAWRFDQESGSWSNTFKRRGTFISTVLAPNGNAIGTKSMHASACILDTKMGQLVSTFPRGRPTRLIASPDSRWIASNGTPDSMLVADVTDSSVRKLFPVHRPLHIDFSPDSSQLLTITKGGLVQIWDIEDESEVVRFQVPFGIASTYSPDGKRIGIGTLDGQVASFNPVTGKISSPQMRTGGRTESLSFSPDGRYLLTTNNKNTAQVWNVKDGLPITPGWHHDSRIRCAEFHREGNQVVTVCNEGVVRIWSLPRKSQFTDQLLHQLCFIHGLTGTEDIRSPSREVVFKKLRSDAAGELRQLTTTTIETWTTRQNESADAAIDVSISSE